MGRLSDLTRVEVGREIGRQNRIKKKKGIPSEGVFTVL